MNVPEIAHSSLADPLSFPFSEELVPLSRGRESQGTDNSRTESLLALSFAKLK